MTMSRTNDIDPPAEPAKTEGNGSSFGLLSELRGSANPAVDPLAKPRKKISGMTMILALVAGGSGALLFAMRHIGTSGRSGLEKVSIEYTRDETVSAASQARLMAQLERTSAPLQVPTTELKLDEKNPFLMPTQTGVVLDVGPLDDPEARARAEAVARLTARKQEVQDKLGAIVLQSVLMGRVPVARVDGAMVKAGDIVGEIFTVKEIRERSILLTADFQEFEVGMPEPGTESGKPSGKGRPPVRATPKKK